MADRALPTIYVLDGSIALTGAFVCARNMAKALKGFARTVLILPACSAIAPEALSDFSEVRYLPIHPLRRKAGAVLLYIPALVASSLMLRRAMRRDRAETLIVNDFHHMQGAVCRLLGFSGKIYTWVRIDPAAFGKVLPAVWLRVADKTSTAMIAVSKHIASLLPPRIETNLVYDGLDLAQPPAYPATLPLRFVYVGNYIAGKGQDHAIEAFARISADFPDIELHFFGGDMGLDRNLAYRETLAERIATHGLDNRVYLHGFTPQPGDVLRGALVALNFSASETFSMTVLEAQGAGLPVIATRSGGPAEIIEDGRTGILVPVGDITAMETAMRRLVEDRQLAVRMGEAARERVVKNFSADAFANKLLKIVQIRT